MSLLDTCVLRQLGIDDRQLVYRWRNSHRIRSVMYNKESITAVQHSEWFDGVLNDSNSSYQIFMVAGRPAGLVNFPRIDRATRSCRWGFYLGETGLPRGSGLAMGYLGLEHGFGPLGLNVVIGETLVSNERAQRFHVRLHFTRAPEPILHVSANGSTQAVVEYRMDRWQWPDCSNEIKKAIVNASVGRR